MGCAPSSPNNHLISLDGRPKVCTCQCHKEVKTMPVKPVMSSSNGSQNDQQAGQEGVSKDDPRIPLSGRQIFLIKRSWKGISRNMNETGINMFLSLFEKNTDLLRFFTTLQSYKTLSELRTSSVLEGHVRGVMMTVDEAITNLDDANYTINMLQAVGQTHIRFDGFDPYAFLLLKEPFLMAAKDTLGDRYTAHMHDIYEKAIVFILSMLVEGFGPTSSGQRSAQKSSPDTRVTSVEDSSVTGDSGDHGQDTVTSSVVSAAGSREEEDSSHGVKLAGEVPSLREE